MSLNAETVSSLPWAQGPHTYERYAASSGTGSQQWYHCFALNPATQLACLVQRPRTPKSMCVCLQTLVRSPLAHRAAEVPLERTAGWCWCQTTLRNATAARGKGLRGGANSVGNSTEQGTILYKATKGTRLLSYLGQGWRPFSA